MPIEERSERQLRDIAQTVEKLTTSPSSNKTYWTDGSLSWENFPGKTPSNRKGHAATIHSYMEPTWKVRVLDQTNSTFTFDEISAKTVSHRDSSWVTDEGECEQALRHEQGHFDITEIFTRKFNERAKDMIGKEYSAANSDTLNLESQLQVIRLWDFENQSRIEFQCNYETVTKNGVELVQQIAQEKVISDLLKK